MGKRIIIVAKNRLNPGAQRTKKILEEAVDSSSVDKTKTMAESVKTKNFDEMLDVLDKVQKKEVDTLFFDSLDLNSESVDLWSQKIKATDPEVRVIVPGGEDKHPIFLPGNLRELLKNETVLKALVFDNKSG